jgi:general secretion pathway protein H
MRISAAGRADARSRGGAPYQHACARAQGRDGFTLVELLVVLTIIALVSAAVVLAIPDPRGNLVAQAERFGARARAAQERAIMDNRPIALRISNSGYRFEIRQEGAWMPMTEKPFAPQDWGEDVRVGASSERTVFDATGFADPIRITLDRGREQVAVEIGNGGEIRVAL